jgi:hypothetical protein
MNTMICLPKFGITTRDPYVSVEVAWVAHQEPTPSRVSFNHFPHFTSSCFFPCGGEADLHKLSTAHHNLGSSRVTPSRLGDFTSKSNKCHEDCFTKLKYSNAQRAHKEDSLNPNLDFSQITQTSQRGVGESSQRLRMSVFRGWHQHPPKEGGGKLLYLSPKN